MRALHAEALRRGLDHDALRDKASGMFAVASLGALDEAQLQAVFRALTNRGFRGRRPKVLDPERRRAMGTAGRKDADPAAPEVMVTAGQIEWLGQLRCDLGWTESTFANFISRQLKGRERILTLADFNRVYWAMKAMRKRRGAGSGERGTA